MNGPEASLWAHLLTITKEGDMASFKALIVMVIWTAIAGFGLFAIGAHEHFRNPIWAIGTAITLLGIHMINMALYFKIAGERPFAWFK